MFVRMNFLCFLSGFLWNVEYWFNKWLILCNGYSSVFFEFVVFVVVFVFLMIMVGSFFDELWLFEFVFIFLEWLNWKFGLLCVCVVLCMNLINMENGGKVFLFWCLNLLVFVIYLFCKFYGNFEVIGFIFVEELK